MADDNCSNHMLDVLIIQYEETKAIFAIPELHAKVGNVHVYIT